MKITSYCRRIMSLHFLVGKFREKGIVWCLKASVNSILVFYQMFRYYFVRFWSKRSVLLRSKFYYHLARLILRPDSRKKRILGIWDFKALPWSIGDPLVFIERLSILKLEHNAEEIDICIVYDREFPAGNRGKDGSHNITPHNAQDYMLEFLPLFSTCPYPGTIYQFNSRKEFHSFVRNNIERYEIFPPLTQHLSETYNYYGGEPHTIEIQTFHNRYGYIPHLRIGERDSSWAYSFYKRYLPEGTVPVSLSLKQTLHAPERNAEPEIWLSFIDMCKVDFAEVTFVVAGLREEVFSGLRERPNIIIAKDFGTSIIEDLALIRTSFLYMATDSGPSIIALYSDLPYLLFQLHVNAMRAHGVEPGEQYRFANDRQKIFSGETRVTTELLFKEFKELYSRLDRNEWYDKVFDRALNKHGHPSATAMGHS